MAIVNSHYGYCAAGGAAPKFTYTGTYNVRKDGVVELLTSGTLVFLNPAVIDVFCVGGGGKGGKDSVDGNNAAAGGGGAGYTATLRKQSVSGQYDITIGAGSTEYSGRTPARGGTTKFGTLVQAEGGYSASQGGLSTAGNGARGGSGGGGAVIANSDYGSGGSDGGNGEQGYRSGGNISGGAGQGATTREFGDPAGKLYAGGGSGGRYMSAQSPVVTPGGAGGGGAGGWAYDSSGAYQNPGAGGANTGGGGGGSVATSWYGMAGGNGGSGIVCFRDAAPLPELAGTWVLNERLYAPENSVDFTGQNFKIGTATDPNAVTARTIICSTTTIKYTTSSGFTSTLYTFSRHEWGSDKYKYLTFPAGATASDEFRAWLASNAVKQ